MITPDMIETWRINYGLDTRSPEDAARWWADRYDGLAPAGAVAAFGYLLKERDAKPQWQGLTDDDVHELTKDVIAFKSDVVKFIREAEAKLKEKNT